VAFAISRNELLRGYSIRGGTHVEHAKRKAPQTGADFT
jgi:hypothetical protein